MAAETPPVTRPGRAAWALLALMAAIYAVLAVGTLCQKSVTVDEFGHLPVGYNVLTTGDFDYCEPNPPLMNVLNALPLLVIDPQDQVVPAPVDDPNLKHNFWANGYAFMARFRSEYHQLFVSARCMTVTVWGLLGVLAFVWAAQLSPRRPALAGLLAAGLVWYSPNMLAHATLVTTDAGAAAFATLSAFTFYRYVRKPTWACAVLAGLTLGLAELVKFSAIFLYPVLLAVAVYAQTRHRTISWGRWTLHGLCVVAVSVIGINAGYLFQGTGQTLGAAPLKSDLLQSFQSAMPSGTPVPLPSAFVDRFDWQLADVQEDEPSFIFGKTYQGGRWYYFLALLAIKTPIPLLGLALAALILAARGRGWPSVESLLLLGLAGAFLAVLSLLDNRQEGLRLILPAAPLFWIWAAATIAKAVERRWHFVALAVLAAWASCETLRTYPDYLAYFNQFVGGPSRGYLYASDSNVDWGQDLIALKRYMDSKGIKRIQLLYFGRVDPEIYGINYEVPAETGFKAGYAAVSVTLLALPYFLYDHGQLMQTFRPTHLNQAVIGPPVAQPGHSILVFRVPDSAPPVPL